MSLKHTEYMNPTVDNPNNTAKSKLSAKFEPAATSKPATLSKPAGKSKPTALSKHAPKSSLAINFQELMCI